MKKSADITLIEYTGFQTAYDLFNAEADPMIHQSSPARVNCVAGLARGSAIQVAGAAVIVSDNVGRYVQHRTVRTKSSLSRMISGCTLNGPIVAH